MRVDRGDHKGLIKSCETVFSSPFSSAFCTTFHSAAEERDCETSRQTCPRPPLGHLPDMSLDVPARESRNPSVIQTERSCKVTRRYR